MAEARFRRPAGYLFLIQRLALDVVAPWHTSTIGGTRASERDANGERDTYPSSYDPGESWLDHLVFALKYDGVDLHVIEAVFAAMDAATVEAELGARLDDRPTSEPLRRLWYLYEWLTERRLDRPDATSGRTAALLDATAYHTGPVRRSRRHRVAVNLLGDRAFCPCVRRTPTIEALAARRLPDAARALVSAFDPDAIRRAVDWLYTKETRSSFEIEREPIGGDRARRFVELLQRAPLPGPLDAETLVAIQRQIVDPRFADTAAYRSEQVYVGESLGYRERIHYVAPRAVDVPELMNGVVQLAARLDDSVDAVVRATAIAFGFVFVHPFRDGNGRLHRFLIHDTLARAGFTPPGVLLPVSAVMLARPHEYDEALESVSRRIIPHIGYTLDDDGVLTVTNDSARFYRYPDLTRATELLYGWIAHTIDHDLREELDFIVRYREARRVIADIVDLPDQRLTLFINVCRNNGGRLSANKRQKYFESLTDAEVAIMEAAVVEMIAPPLP